MTTSLREKAKELFHLVYDNVDRDGEIDSEDKYIIEIHEALEAAYKEGALARVTGPSDFNLEIFIQKTPTSFSNAQLRTLVKASIAWYRDNLKITPLTAEEIGQFLPTEQEMYEATGSISVDAKWLRDFVSAKLEG